MYIIHILYQPGTLQNTHGIIEFSHRGSFQDLQLRPWASMVGVSSILQCRSAAGLGEKHHPKWGLNMIKYHPCLAKTWMIVDDSMHLDDFSPFIDFIAI